MRLFVALLTGCAFAAAPAAAQTTLSDALVTAYRSNPTLAADREGLKILDEDVASARAAGRPTLVAEGNLTHSALDVDGTGGIVGARLTQPVFRGGRIRNSIAASDANVEAGRQSLRQSEADVFLAVIDSYSAVLRDEEIVRLNAAQVTTLGEIRAAEQRRLDLGERTRTDVAQADARLSTLLANVTTAERRLEESRTRFRELTGLAPDGLAPLPDLPSLPGSMDDAMAAAWSENPRILQARAAEKVASYQIRVAEGGLLPTVDASASVNRRDEIVQILGRRLNQDLATFQMVVTVPIFQGGAEYAAVRRAKHTRALRMREIDEATNEVTRDVAVAWKRLETARAAVSALGEAVSANDRAVAGVRREAGVGSRTTLDLLDAERELRDAQVSLVAARHDAYVAGYRLLAAIGRLSVERLGLPTDAYDPDEHYRRSAGRWVGMR